MNELLGYSEALDYFSEEGNKPRIDLVRHLWDNRPTRGLEYNGFSKIPGVNVLGIIGMGTGNWKPLGNFSRFNSSWTKREVYEELSSIFEKVVLKGKTFLDVFLEVMREHARAWGRSPVGRFGKKEFFSSVSAWLYGTVEGILGEGQIVKKLEKVFDGTRITPSRAPSSYEAKDVDVTLSTSGREVLVSVKCGSSIETVKSSIKHKRAMGKKVDFYTGFYKKNGRKVYYGSFNGDDFIPFSKFFEKVGEVYG